MMNNNRPNYQLALDQSAGSENKNEKPKATEQTGASGSSASSSLLQKALQATEAGPAQASAEAVKDKKQGSGLLQRALRETGAQEEDTLLQRALKQTGGYEQENAYQQALKQLEANERTSKRSQVMLQGFHADPVRQAGAEAELLAKQYQRNAPLYQTLGENAYSGNQYKTYLEKLTGANRKYEQAVGRYNSVLDQQMEELKRTDPAAWYAQTMSTKDVEAALAAAEEKVRRAGSLESAPYASMAPSYQTDLKLGSEHDRQRRQRGEDLEAATQERDQLKQALAYRQQIDKKEAYEAMRSNPDFEEKSRFESTKHGNPVFHAISGTYTDTGYDDPLYDAVNGDRDAQRFVNLQDLQASNSYGLSSEFYHLSDEQRKLYNYVYRTKGAAAAKEYLLTVANYNTSPMLAAMLGGLRGAGLSSLSEAAANVLGDGSEMDDVRQMEAAAQRQNTGAYGVGSIAGNIALMAAAGKVAGAAAKAMGLGGAQLTTVRLGSEFVKVYTTPAITKMATSAMTFALTDAIQNAGSLSAGRMSVGEYLGSVGTGAAGGAVGSLASYLTESGMALFLTKHKWMTVFGEYARKVSAATAFSAANMGTKQLLSGEKMDPEEMGRQLVSSFLYSLISSGLQTISETREYKAGLSALQENIGRAYSRLSDAGLSAAEKAQLAEQIINWTEQLQDGINHLYLPGQQKYVNDMNAALDGMKELMAGYGRVNAERAGWSGSGNLLPDGGTGGTGLTVYRPQNGGPGLQEVRAELSTQIQAGLQEGLQLAKAYPVNRDAAQEIRTPVSTELLPTAPAGTAEQETAFPSGQIASRDSGRLEQIRQDAKQAAIAESAGMDTEQLRQLAASYQGALEENTGNAEFRAEAEGQLEGLQEALTRRQIEAGDDLGLAEGLGRVGLEQAPADFGRRAMPAPTVTGERIATGGEAALAMTNKEEVLNNGTGNQNTAAEGLADGGQRDAGLGTGEQAGGLGSGAEGSVSRGAAAQELAQLRNQIRALEAERRSAAQIGVAYGTKNENLRVVPEELYTSAMRAEQARAEENGVRLTFVTSGAIELRAKGGRIIKADGLHQVDADGTSHIFARADSRRFTPEQLTKHEDFHDMVANNRGLLLDMVEALYETQGEEGVARLVDAYVTALDGCYGVYTEGMTEDDQRALAMLYLEEIFADQYAGMNRSSVSARQAVRTAGDVAQRFAGDIENARQNRAGIERRNGPGQRFSIQDVQGQNGEYPDCVVLDTNLFDGIPTRRWGEVLQDYFYDNYAEKELTIFKENWYSETVRVARANDRTLKSGAKRNHRVIDDLAYNPGNNIKNLAVAHLPELLVVSTYGKNTLDHLHQWLDENGWTLRKVHLCDIKGKIYEATLNIAEARDGRRIIYDISLIHQIDRRTAGGNVPSTVSGRGQPTSRSSSKQILPDPNVPVKHFSSEQQKTRIDIDYQRAVDNGDTRTVQRMLDEVAKRAGYSIKAWHGTPKRGITSFDQNKIGTNTDDGRYGRGFYFSTNKVSADQYANTDGETMPVYLSAKNPWWAVAYHDKAEVADILGMDESALTYTSSGLSSKVVVPSLSQAAQFSSHLMEQGYDSIVIQHGSNDYEVVVFDAEQIKSAEPVTRDEQGKVIPLSERFRTDRAGKEAWKNRDIRFSPSEEEEGVDWVGSREALPENKESSKWSELRGRVAGMTEGQRKRLVAEAAELNEATWREGGLGIRPYSGSLNDTEAVVRYVDDVVDTVKAEPGSYDYDPSFDIEALPENKESYSRFSASDESDEIDRIGNRQETEETDSSAKRDGRPVHYGAQNDNEGTEKRIATTPDRPRKNNAGEGLAENGGPMRASAPTENAGGQIARATDKLEALAREKKVAKAEAAGIDTLKSRIKSDEERLKTLKALKSTGLMGRDAKTMTEYQQQIADVEESLKIDREALAEKQAAKKAELAGKEAKAAKKAERAAEKKALAKEAELKDNKPRQARKEFRQDALNLFSVPAGKRQTLGNILNSFADKVTAQGSVSEADRAELFRQLYEAGVEVAQPEDYYRDIRDFVKSGRVYVPEDVRAEFGDDWDAFRKRAWGNGIYLTNDQNDRGADAWNAELAEVFPGSFDQSETDVRNMLENIVNLAEEGKAEFVSIEEMMRRNQDQHGVTVDQQMDELEQKVDHLIDTFAQKAELEQKVKKAGVMQLVKERQKNRELAAQQTQRKRENETRSQVMKQLQALNKMRKKSGPEIRAQIDSIIGNLDTMARSISPEGMENLQALARKYSEAAQDPNFLGNPYVEARLARLNQVQLDTLEISDVIELGRTISALVKSVTEDRRLLTDARNREISEAASMVAKEIQGSAGSKGGKLRDFLGNEHLSPTREIQRLGGWVRGGQMEQLSRALEDGGTRRMDYQRQATRIFDGFLADKDNQKWLQTAQGKKAEWIIVTVPAGITGEDGSLKIENITFEITPMMRVGLLMHSRNVDNLRHIETGGIVIPSKEYYRKGDLANADAKGTRVKLRPEIVRAIVKDCTAQERAFAGLLEQYYDGFSKEKINEVSMQIDGFERAGGDHYYGIKVSRKFLAAQPEQVQKNLALDSIGSIVNERVHAGNPIILEDASKALTDHIDLISKYYGYTAPIRDFNAVMNYTFHGEGVPYAGSIKEILQDKWGSGAQKYLDKLLGDLQQSSGINETAAKFLAKLRGNLAGASLMFNPAVALSQTASLPGAMQTLGLDGIVATLKPEKVDMGLIEKYSPVLWYRNQGNSTQELGDYMKEKGLEGKLPFFFNWIQKMDAWTIRRIWAGAEYRVSKDTDLAPGSKAEIDAGTDPYYQEVARVFQRAVYDTQPNYSEMQRPAILRSESDLTKMLTMYKTVPLQYYNMMYEAVGRLRADKARFEQDGSAENKSNYEKSKSFAAKTFVGVLGANVVYIVMKALIKGTIGGKKKKYLDDEGNLDWGKIFGSLGKDLIETYAGSVIGGSDLLTGVEKLWDAATTGSYSRYGGTEISALSAIEDTLGGIYNLAKEIHDQDLTGGLGAIKALAKQISMNTGFPANNIETYLLGTLKWIAPEWVDRYENFFDEFERTDLKGEHGRDLRAAIRVLMDNRTDGLMDETIDEIMRLWETGQNAAIPSAIPGKVSVNGEDVEIKGADRSTFRERWGQVIDGSLEDLLASDAYEAADDAGKAKLISKLYEYARQQAAAAVTEREPDAWVEFGKACEAAGIGLTDYLAVASVDKSKLKDMDGEELESAIKARMEFRVGELDEKTLDELGRLYAGGGTGAIPADVPTGVSVGGEEQKLTPEERVAWLQAWKKLAGEGLEPLMGSDPYKAADDTGKTKMISSLYSLARAAASSEVVDGYAPDKWVTVGLEAAAYGVPIEEYTAFHVDISGMTSSEKLSLLKKQSWSEKQKEFIWKNLLASDSQSAKYENLKNAGLKWSEAMTQLGIGDSSSSSGLTDAQKAQYDKYWNEISGPATKRLLNNSAYKQAEQATQAAYIDRLNDYAARSAKAKVLEGYDKGKWVECGERLTSAGVPLDDYIVYYEGISDAKSRQKYEALAQTGWTDSQMLIAMEYISSTTFNAAKVGESYQISTKLYLEGLSKADTDQSGNISQEEAETYLDGLSIGWEEKAYLWQMLCSSSKWKKNPYSTRFGEEIWHSLHPEG